MPGRKMGYETPPFDVAVRRTSRADRNGSQRLNLRQENAVFGGTGGVSEQNRPLGFRPAYRNAATGRIVFSRFADGRIAPVHVLDGLPDDWVVARDAQGRVCRVLATVHAGFVRHGEFYTREAAAKATAGSS